MMQKLGMWVIRLTVAALISGIVLSFTREKVTKTTVRMICNVFLTITALEPLVWFSFPDLNGLMQPYLEQGMEAAALGEKLAAEELQERIKLGLETYILDKAAGWNVLLDVSVIMDDAGNPLCVELTGTVSPSVRQELEMVIANDLGIPREDQKWIGATKRTP